ncbi:MAG: 5-deoxy-glucuronate isomerase [Anaerolineales bacterium]
MIKKYQVNAGGGHQSVLKAGENDSWLGLEVLRLESGGKWESESKEEEAALVPFSGRCSVRISGAGEAEWKAVGGRADIFGGSPHAVYVPRRCKFEVFADTKLELVIAKAPCDADKAPALVKPEDVRVVSAGAANWRRDVRLVIPPGSPVSQRMIIGETINPPGNWSGIPPHKHDEITGVENILEEFYLFKVKPVKGYGVQLGYKDGKEESYVIHDGDVFLMENGYHPTVASPGTTLGYFWVLSGDDKAYNITTDPGFDWVGNAEAVLKEMQR